MSGKDWGREKKESGEERKREGEEWGEGAESS